MRISDWSSDVCSSDLVYLGENTVIASQKAAQASASADAAALSEATAESAAGPTYSDTSAGLAATTNGQSFAVDNGDGTVTIYLNDGGVAVAQRTIATTAALRRSEEHTSELQSLMRTSYAGFCLKKKRNMIKQTKTTTTDQKSQTH